MKTEWLPAPQKATAEMLAAVAPKTDLATIEDYTTATAAAELLPAVSHPRALEVLAELARDYRNLLVAARACRNDLAELCEDRAVLIPKATWFVWSKHGRTPHFAHGSEASATAEATRLANRHPGNSFLVMQCTHKMRAEPIIDPEPARDTLAGAIAKGVG